MTLVYVDCDNFKNINDTRGHKQGDAVLTLIARTIENNIRSTDLGGRLGGDEFCILLPESSIDSSKEVVTRIQNLLIKVVSQNDFQVTFSIGVATFESLLDTLDGMIHHADELMYEAKKNGKNNIRYKVFRDIS